MKCHFSAKPISAHQGFTLIELAVTLVVMSLMLASFGLATSTVLGAREAAMQKEELTRNASFAMQRMVVAVRETTALMLPLADNPASTQNESLRERRVPPEIGKEKQTAVLAVRLGANIDRNADGVPDADNDGDGRVDEDPGADTTFDLAPGIIDIDDDNDGWVDEGFWSFNDDDEDGSNNEDPHGGGDDDGDFSIDEDPPGDLNNDNEPGIAGFDDDGDGLVDEGFDSDDDEDGRTGEDWYDPVVFYLVGNNLIERQAVPYNLIGNGWISGRDFIEVVIAENVTFFRVERIARPGARARLVDITLELSSANGESVSLNTRVRVGERT